MKLAEVSIRRPVFAVMMSLALIILGVFSFRTLGVDLMPKTEQPTVNVRVNLPGASPEEVETELTKPLEEAVNTINGIDELRAGSNQGGSNVQITFNLDRDMESAVQDVRDKVAPLRFPRDATPPSVTKTDPDSAPILTLAVSSNRDPKQLTQIVDKQILQVLGTVSGVGGINLSGDRRRQIQLSLDLDRMAAYSLTADSVRNAVDRQNIDVPGGTFIAGPSEIALRTLGRLTAIADFRRIILLQNRDGSSINLTDVVHVRDSVQEIRSITRVDGTPSVSLAITKQSGSNTVAVVDAIQAKVEEIKQTLPADIQIQTRADQSIFIRKSIEDIEHHLILGSLFAAFVVFLFLRNFRSTLIAATAIPVSLIATFSVMKIFGLTLNNMTLLALSLATGIVIDDAIVVLENIFRFVEEKNVTPQQAAADATSEIGLAVMATTLSLVVIFLPVIFMSGILGQYLLSFGIVSAAAILFSMFVSFTLTPALCSILLRSKDVTHGESKAAAGTSKNRGFYSLLDRGYAGMLRWSLKHRFVMGMVAIAVAVSAAFIYPRLGRELAPNDDQSEFQVGLNLADGTSIQRTEEYLKDVEGILRKLPEVRTIFTTITPGNGAFLVGLTPLETRTISQQTLMRQARQTLATRYPAARMTMFGGTDISGASTAQSQPVGGGTGIVVLIQGPDLDDLANYMNQFQAKLKTVRGIADVNTNFQPTAQELRVIIDRARAADLGVSVDTLASNVRTLVGGQVLDTKFRDGDDEYEVLLRLDEPFRNDPQRLGNLLVPSATHGAVRLSDVAQLNLDYRPLAINRYNRQRQITLRTSMDGLPLAAAVAAIREKASEINMKPGYSVVFSGNAKNLEDSSNTFMIAIFLAVVFIYMVLASQFNSLIHPLTIMVSLPLSLPCGLLALLALGMTLNVYSGIGMLMLFGIVKKNSILQVDYTNTLRAQGMERHEALITASRVRLRPILMTTISIIAGMLPIAFGRGAGAASRASMAVTIIGGQILCLLLTLLITPVVYSYFDDLREWSPAKMFARTAKPEDELA